MNASADKLAQAQPTVPAAVSLALTRLDGGEILDPELAAALLESMALDGEDLLPWASFDHPVRDSYGRRLLARGTNYELMVMSWLPGDYSAIHDHGAAEWGAVRYFGSTDHMVFDETGGRLSRRSRETMSRGDVVAVDHSLIHLMGNPTDTPMMSLHLYGRAASADSITGGARVFDLYENCIQRTDGGVFYCLPEGDIVRRECCPEPDPDVRRIHHQLMLSRLERACACGQPEPALLARKERLSVEIERLARRERAWAV